MIEDRSFLPWLATVPSAEVVKEQARPVTAQHINKLEELWKYHPEASIEDLDKPGIDDEPSPVLLK